MASILLSTLNARYSHCAFGLRYLHANLKELRPSARILEFTIADNPRDIVDAILKENPSIVGFGVYIWNVRQTTEVVSMLKRLRPRLRIVLGGPEVSYETDLQPICQIADLTIKGEAELLFYEICSKFLANNQWPDRPWVLGELPPLNELILPYGLYSDDDIRHRVIYVEASRGCPYKCEYCLSSLDKAVRGFDLDLFLSEIDKLVKRGARQFKFVDRTFNLSPKTSTRILRYFLERIEIGLFLHFEMVPDRLPAELRELIAAFPPGSLQFEIGVQTWNPEVGRLVSRRQDYPKIRENFAFLTTQTGVHTHADLIAGLPGESLESFAEGFDSLVELGPSEIQVGILKRLRGTPIVRHDQQWKMIYQEHPPYQVLETSEMSFETLQRIGRFARFWDMIANSGNFPRTLKLIEAMSKQREDESMFWEFDGLSAFLANRHPQSGGVALVHLLESIWEHFRSKDIAMHDRAYEALLSDYAFGKVRRDVPAFLKRYASGAAELPLRFSGELSASGDGQASLLATPRRQRRHLQSSAQCLSEKR